MNKVNSKAVLRWVVVSNQTVPEGVRQRFLKRFSHRLTKEGELILSSQRFRDRGRNVADCIERLREMLLEVAQPPKQRKATRPTLASKRRRREGKEDISQKKQGRRPPSQQE